MLAVVHEDYKKLNASGGTTVILSDHWYMDCCFSKIIYLIFLFGSLLQYATLNRNYDFPLTLLPSHLAVCTKQV